MYYLISATLNNHLLVLLFVSVTAIICIFVILPAIKGSNEYITRFKMAVILAIIVGFIFGILKSTLFIISNKYLQFKMYYLIVYLASPILNSYLLATLGTIIFVLIILSTIKAFLSFIGVNGKASKIIVCGILPSLLMFIIGGYWINKTYLPKFFELKSIIGNALWALICVLLVWAIGWIIFKISQIKFNSSLKICNLKTLIIILSLVILFNVAHYFYYSPLVKTDRSNLILISIDTLRADHLSCYGYPRNTTPNIDRFAKDGVLFANTIAQSSWTLLSHMSLLTGLYVSSHGVISEDRKLSDEHLTLAEILQNAGYETVAFTDGGYLSHKWGYQGFDRFDDTGKGIESIYIKAVNWLRRGYFRSFFLFLHTYEPHSPYDPPPAYDIYSDKNYEGIVDISAGTLSDYYESIKSKMTLKDYIYVVDKYDGGIYYTDHFLGKLFKELRDLGLYDKSIIVLTSDHGENFLDHTNSPFGFIGHIELYDEIVKVPLIIKAPKLPKSKILNAQVESIDIMPTILELLRISIPNKVDGVSLLKLVEKGSYGKVFAFSERAHREYKELKMIRSNDWKLLFRSRNGSEPLELELYNLKIDPKEQDNLFAEEEETGGFLYKKLSSWMDSQEEKSKLLSVDKIEPDDELIEQLKALGYIN